MKTIYEKNRPEAVAMVDEVTATYHPVITQGPRPLKILVVLTYKLDNHEEFVHAVKLHGTPAAAVIRKLNAKRRTLTGYDLELELDGRKWDENSTEYRRALVDHELTHVVMLTEPSTGKVKADEEGNPRFKLKPDDFTLTGFYEVVQRHGLVAGEATDVLKVHARVQDALRAAAANLAAVVTQSTAA